MNKLIATFSIFIISVSFLTHKKEKAGLLYYRRQHGKEW
jgi:hypothetical protein